MNWKVTVNINNNKEQKILYIRNVKTKGDAYLKAKQYIIQIHPEIDFCGVENAVII